MTQDNDRGPLRKAWSNRQSLPRLSEYYRPNNLILIIPAILGAVLIGPLAITIGILLLWFFGDFDLTD